MKKNKTLPLNILLFALILMIAINTVNAETFTVTRSDDRNTSCNSGMDCSLREAVNAANAAASDDVINFNQNLTMITLSNEIVIQNAGTLTITGLGAKFLTINGNGQNNIPANPYGNRIFFINGAIVTITDVKLTGGYFKGPPVNNEGGAIKVVEGTLSLDRVHITENKGLFGGGIYYSGGTNHRILNSTFSKNSAHIYSGGGFYLNSGTPLYVANTTISSNEARVGFIDGSGGFFGDPTLRNVTIAYNTGSLNGNSYNGNPDIRNSIVVGNNRGNHKRSPFLTTCQIVSDNLFVNGNTAGCRPETVLGQLKDNGGPTPTHALLPNSLAIDAGNNAFAVDPLTNSLLSIDQRGFVRIVGGNNNGAAIVDIGAVEFNSTQPPTN